MFIQVVTLVFWFLTLIHFPKSESTPSIFSKRYGEKILGEVSEFQNLDCKLKKVQLDLVF